MKFSFFKPWIIFDEIILLESFQQLQQAGPYSLNTIDNILYKLFYKFEVFLLPIFGLTNLAT